jgi:hypothetical protein
MRRLLILAVALVALVGMLAPPAMAQAPAPKVTITGLIDQIGTYNRNMSVYDGNYNRTGDNSTYGRTRGRFDVIGEVGKVKGVLGLEIDTYYGQIGSADNNQVGCVTGAAGGAVTCATQGFGSTGSFDLNTDTQGVIEVKWLYTEFPLPLVPFNSMMRLGAQPFGTLATNKLAVYANGDFAGAALTLEPVAGFKANLAYVQVEESLTGHRDFLPLTSGASISPQNRGDDWAMIMSFDFSPFKGLDIKPMYSYFNAIGLTSGSARGGRGGLSIAAGGNFAPLAINNGEGTGVIENRHTIGVDARWTAGPFSLQPTFLYQFGDRDSYITLPQYGAVGTKANADISAMLVDVRAGFNIGPLALGGMVMWTSGDPAHNNPHNKIGYFQPLSTDTSYAADWGTQIFSLGIDYFNILYSPASGMNLGNAIGYDKYGRLQAGFKAAYAITPSFTLGAGVTANWTDKSVDTDSAFAAASGLTPSQVSRTTLANARPEGDSRYLGTELNLSATYRFAPGVTLDLAGGYLFAGNALAHRFPATGYATTAPVSKDIGVSDVLIGTARVRYAF